MTDCRPHAAVCDPVMGDLGKLYVKPDLIDAFISDVVPLASILTPNQTEAQLLTGLTITSIQDALGACDRLHEMGPHTVVRLRCSQQPPSLTCTCGGSPADWTCSSTA
jgi:pyridoxal/pyridoxine/pyridoxamine kinase